MARNQQHKTPRTILQPEVDRARGRLDSAIRLHLRHFVFLQCLKYHERALSLDSSSPLPSFSKLEGWHWALNAMLFLTARVIVLRKKRYWAGWKANTRAVSKIRVGSGCVDEAWKKAGKMGDGWMKMKWKEASWIEMSGTTEQVM